MGQTLAVPEPSELSEVARQHAFGGDPSLAAVASLLKDGLVRRVLVAAGAGISVSAGIPDFRTPGTGLYDNLQKYELPQPEAVFTLEYFKERPQPFCALSKEIMPGEFKPTPTHHFIRLLEKKGLLLRCFTQNIDGLERLAKVAPELLVESHGSFADAHCVECRKQHSVRWWREQVQADELPRCGAEVSIPPPPPPPSEADVEALQQELEQAKLERSKDMFSIKLGLKVAEVVKKLEVAQALRAEAPAKQAAWEEGPKTFLCEGLVKPDIVFFGESLPARFTYLAGRDGARADLLIVMGTSLKVMPFAGILGRVGPLCPRLLINRELVGCHGQEDPPMFFGNIGLRMNEADNYRDVHVADDCDNGVRALCALAGWKADLEALEREYQAEQDAFEVLARTQGTQAEFDETHATELARRVYDAMRALSPAGVAGGAAMEGAAQEGTLGLSRGHFAAAAECLARAGEEQPLLVAFADADGGPERAKDIELAEFTDLMRVALKALGQVTFCAVAERQACVLAAGAGAGAEDEIAAAFGKFDTRKAGSFGYDRAFELLQTWDPQVWTKKRIARWLHEVDINRDGHIDLCEFTAWLAQAPAPARQVILQGGVGTGDGARVARASASAKAPAVKAAPGARAASATRAKAKAKAAGRS